MSFEKIKSIKVSERVFDLVKEEIDLFNEDILHKGVKLSGYLSTFNNCREQGYYLSIDCETKEKFFDYIFIWVFESRNSDEIVVVTSLTYPINKGMFTEEDYVKSNKYFSWNEEHKAAEYIVKKIKEHFTLVYGDI